jgi:hypothetical protein
MASTDTGQILEKKWEYNGTVHQLLIDFKEAMTQLREKFFYNILLEFYIPKKLMRPIKMCLMKLIAKPV